MTLLQTQTQISNTSFPSLPPLTQPRIKLHNHLPNSYIIGNKKALFKTMSDYYTKKGDDVFNYLPLTFHICNGLEDEKYFKFLNYYYAFAKNSGNNSSGNNG